MDNIKLIKAAIGFVTGSGVTLIVGGIVDNNVFAKTNVQKACIFAGKVGIASVINSAVKARTDETVDNAITWYNETFAEEEENAEPV